MEAAKVIGKVAHYRLPHDKEPKESKVVAIRTLTSLAGDEMTLLKMENGDEEGAESCYFDLSTAAASS